MNFLCSFAFFAFSFSFLRRYVAFDPPILWRHASLMHLRLTGSWRRKSTTMGPQPRSCRPWGRLPPSPCPPLPRRRAPPRRGARTLGLVRRGNPCPATPQRRRPISKDVALLRRALGPRVHFWCMVGNFQIWGCCGGHNNHDFGVRNFSDGDGVA